MSLKPEKLHRDLDELGKIGYREGHGITRVALSEEDLRAREWLESRMKEAGLSVRWDEAGNVIGMLPAADEVENPRTVVVGSHLDTVPEGGKFDGSLGVLGGLECARALIEDGEKLPWNLEIIDFTDEEGYHFAGTFGSRVMMGNADEEELYHTKVEGIPTLAERFESLDMDPDDVLTAQRDPRDFRAYFEMHVEQGGRMEKQGLDVASVTGIVGIYRYVVKVLGEANHAGTTPMSERDDALVAASPVFSLLSEWAKVRAPEMVGTVGQLTVEPGAQNIIPGKCRFSVELRSLESRDMCRVRDRLRDWLQENTRHEISNVLEKDGVRLDSQLIDLVMDAAEKQGYTAKRMPSGAGHDAQSFAPYIPTGMIFIPSQGGLSHCPDEYSKPEWVTKGATTLYSTLRKLARRDSE